MADLFVHFGRSGLITSRRRVSRPPGLPGTVTRRGVTLEGRVGTRQGEGMVPARIGTCPHASKPWACGVPDPSGSTRWVPGTEYIAQLRDVLDALQWGCWVGWVPLQCGNPSVCWDPPVLRVPARCTRGMPN